MLVEGMVLLSCRMWPALFLGRPVTQRLLPALILCGYCLIEESDGPRVEICVCVSPPANTQIFVWCARDCKS